MRNSGNPRIVKNPIHRDVENDRYLIPVLGYDLRTPSGGKRCLEWFCMTEGSCVDVCIVFSSKSHENNSKTSSFPLLVAL